jgi:hypothetical protein
MNDDYNAMKFRLIAALAADIAEKLARNGAWPGEVTQASQAIARVLDEVKSDR